MRKREPDHVSHERWLVSYADFITLLFAFFVVMFAISQVDAKKLGRFVESVNSASDIQGVFPNAAPPSVQNHDQGRNGIRPAIAPGRISILNGSGGMSRKALELRRSLGRILHSSTLADKVRIRADARGVTVSLSEAGFFDTGEAQVKPEAMETLREIAETLKDASIPIAVEGHTDDVPIQTPQFPSNWELSTVRATTIVRYLIDTMRYDPMRLSATGFAEYRPVADNATPEGRALNRRVDLVILTEGTEAPAPSAAATRGN